MHARSSGGHAAADDKQIWHAIWHAIWHSQISAKRPGMPRQQPDVSCVVVVVPSYAYGRSNRSDNGSSPSVSV
ncbi:hypothetical protein CspHIS471_0507140 [Cutaneotrichosporon sp. HIS471]|nr:hypothetical protein CspHIS471_0507140 [Cutaneotrichosporon sp. HIS471]